MHFLAVLSKDANKGGASGCVSHKGASLEAFVIIRARKDGICDPTLPPSCLKYSIVGRCGSTGHDDGYPPHQSAPPTTSPQGEALCAKYSIGIPTRRDRKKISPDYKMSKYAIQKERLNPLPLLGLSQFCFRT